MTSGEGASEEFKVFVTCHRAATAESQKALLILPPTGGTNLIDRSYARQFQAHGYDVYVLDSWTNMNLTGSDLELHQTFYGSAQRAIALVIDRVSAPSIGLLGTSVGALHVAIAASVQQKVTAAFSILGGLPIAELIVKSDQKAMVDLKTTRMRRFHFKSDAEIIEAIGKVFFLEPKELPKNFRHKDLGLAIALNDSTVLTDNQIQLRDFWKPKIVVSMNCGHFWGIVRVWLFKSQTLIDFFDQSAASKKKGAPKAP